MNPNLSVLKNKRKMVMFLILMAAIAGVALSSFFLGKMQARSELIKSGTIVAQVKNEWSSDQEVKVYVNGELRETMQVPSGQTLTVLIAVEFGGTSQAYFKVLAQPVFGTSDDEMVLVTPGGTSIASLKVG